MGLRLSKEKRPNQDDLKSNMNLSEPLASHQQSQAQTAASSSQPKKKRDVNNGIVSSSKVEPQELGADEAKISPQRRRSRRNTPKQLFLELDRKRKAPVGLSSLAINCAGPSLPIIKRYKPCDRARMAVPDKGMGLAMVGRRVKKGASKGRITGYNHSSKSYQVKYLYGKEEALEWCNLKPWLLESDSEGAPVHDDSRPSMSQSCLLPNRWRKS